MNLPRGVAVLSVVMCAMPAAAKPVYKCERDGAITYTDQPCASGAAAAELPGLIVTTPPTASQRDLAREHDARLARDRAERDAADAQWLEQHERREAAREQAAESPDQRPKRKRSRK
jgi:hypothetical protein